MVKNKFDDKNIFLAVLGPIINIEAIVEAHSGKIDAKKLARIILTNRFCYSDLHTQVFIGENEKSVLDFSFDYYKQYNFMPYSIVNLETLYTIKNAFLTMDEDKVIIIDNEDANIFFVETMNGNQMIPYVIKAASKQRVSEFFKIKNEKVVTFYDKVDLNTTISSLESVKSGEDEDFFIIQG